MNAVAELRRKSKRTDAFEMHVHHGGRLATCPKCETIAVVSKNGDAMAWTCEGCGEDVIAPALPTSNLERMLFVDAKANPDDPNVWGYVRLFKLRRDGCEHPIEARRKADLGSYYCSRCGARWDMRMPSARPSERAGKPRAAKANMDFDAALSQLAQKVKGAVGSEDDLVALLGAAKELSDAKKQAQTTGDDAAYKRLRQKRVTDLIKWHNDQERRRR